MPHIVDSHEIEIPWPNAALAKHIELPRWAPIRIGGFVIDLSPTKHVVMMLVSATLAFLLAAQFLSQAADGLAQAAFADALLGGASSAHLPPDHYPALAEMKILATRYPEST